MCVFFFFSYSSVFSDFVSKIFQGGQNYFVEPLCSFPCINSTKDIQEEELFMEFKLKVFGFVTGFVRDGEMERWRLNMNNLM